MLSRVEDSSSGGLCAQYESQHLICLTNMQGLHTQDSGTGCSNTVLILWQWQLYKHGRDECDLERMDKVKCNQDMTGQYGFEGGNSMTNE